jgi:hypothetical protein
VFVSGFAGFAGFNIAANFSFNSKSEIDGMGIEENDIDVCDDSGATVLFFDNTSLETDGVAEVVLSISFAVTV